MDAAPWTPQSQLQRRKRPAKPASDSDGKADMGKRVVMACLCCRRRKIRCDGGQPACSNCTKMGREDCSYQRVSAEENEEVKARKRMLKAQKEAGGGGGALGSRRRWNRKIDLGRSTRRRRTTTPSTRSPSPAPSNTGLTPATYDWSVKSPSEARAVSPTQARQSYFDYPAAAAMLPTPQDEAAAHVFWPRMGSPYDKRATCAAPVKATFPLTPPEERCVSAARSIALPPIQEVYSRRPTLVHHNSVSFVQQTAPYAVQNAIVPLMVERSWALQRSRHTSTHTLVSPDPSAPPSPNVPSCLALPETTPLVAPIPTRPPQNFEFLAHYPTPMNSWDGTAAATYAVRPPRDEILAPAPVPSWDAVLVDDEVDPSTCDPEAWLDQQGRQPLADFSEYQQVW